MNEIDAIELFDKAERIAVALEDIGSYRER